MKKHILNITNEIKRVDLYISKELRITRSQAKKLIIDGYVKHNQIIINKSSLKLTSGVLEIVIPELKSIEAKAIDIPIKIIYQDDDLAIIDKESGIVVHSGAGNSEYTLVNGLLFHISNLSGIGGKIRPGIVHRLDKETSGIMVIAKHDKSHLDLSKQFQDRQVGKKYYAIVRGNTKDSGRIETKIDRSTKDRKKMSVSNSGRNAITSYKKIKSNNKYSLLDVTIETGRTHQIRVHMAHIGHPVAGDIKYGSREGYSRHFLDCYLLSFKHPTSKKQVIFEKQIEDSFSKIMEDLG